MLTTKKKLQNVYTGCFFDERIETHLLELSVKRSPPALDGRWLRTTSCSCNSSSSLIQIFRNYSSSTIIWYSTILELEQHVSIQWCISWVGSVVPSVLEIVAEGSLFVLLSNERRVSYLPMQIDPQYSKVVLHYSPLYFPPKGHRRPRRPWWPLQPLHHSQSSTVRSVLTAVRPRSTCGAVKSGHTY